MKEINTNNERMQVKVSITPGKIHFGNAMIRKFIPYSGIPDKIDTGIFPINVSEFFTVYGLETKKWKQHIV